MTSLSKCRWCGLIHTHMCGLVKAIEYHADGVTVKRVEFRDYQQIGIPSAWQPDYKPTTITTSTGDKP